MEEKDLDCYVNVEDIFYGFENELLKTPISVIKEKTKYKTKLQLICAIFMYFLYLVIKDIITNKSIFKPYGISSHELSMRKVKEEEFIERYKSGEFKDILPFISDNSTYELSLQDSLNINDLYTPHSFSSGFVLDTKNQKIISDRVNSGNGYI